MSQHRCATTRIAVSVDTTRTPTQYRLSGQSGPITLGLGVYQFTGIPAEYPLAILNKGNTRLIKYQGDPSSVVTAPVTGSTANGTYQFYSGTVTVTVVGDFNQISLASSNPDYRGGEYQLVYDPRCNRKVPTSSRETPQSQSARPPSTRTTVRYPGPGLAAIQAATYGNVTRPGPPGQNNSNIRYQLANQV